MHYTAWPDHGVPQNAMSVISFLRRVCREHPHCLDQPLLVHCSAGVGRTGTFILLDTVMQQMKNEGTLSIYNVLKNVRDQRMKMVQTKVITISRFKILPPRDVQIYNHQFCISICCIFVFCIRFFHIVFCCML